MSKLAKLNLKTVQRNVTKDPVIVRREKLCVALTEQLNVHAAALKGEDYAVPVKRWKDDENGERVQLEGKKKVRAWFFEQDGGWYVQCRYGSRILNINGKSNAVFVDKLDDVAGVLSVFKEAVKAGELDAMIEQQAGSPKLKGK